MLGEDEKYSNASSLKQENNKYNYEPETQVHTHAYNVTYWHCTDTSVILQHAHKTSDIDNCEYYLELTQIKKKN